MFSDIGFFMKGHKNMHQWMLMSCSL